MMACDDILDATTDFFCRDDNRVLVVKKDNSKVKYLVRQAGDEERRACVLCSASSTWCIYAAAIARC